MTALVLVGMSIAEARERDVRQAGEAGATLAFFQHGDPSLVRELDRLAAAGVPHITLRGAPTRPPPSSTPPSKRPGSATTRCW